MRSVVPRLGCLPRDDKLDRSLADPRAASRLPVGAAGTTGKPMMALKLASRRLPATTEVKLETQLASTV